MSSYSDQQETPSEEELQREQEWARILSELHSAPTSIALQAYFADLKNRSPSWHNATFIEGANRFANLWGLKRGKLFTNKLQGLHSPNSLVKEWNVQHFQHPITPLDQGFRLQCPPSWSRELRNRRWVVIYLREAPLSQGLNEFIQGPSTIDCGMFCQLLIWMAIRHLLGDDLFDKLFRFQVGQFVLTQTWHKPMDHARSKGNLLFHFYDRSIGTTTAVSSEHTLRLETKNVFNHPAYDSKHPGGHGRLENLTHIGDYNITFDPESPENILSNEKLDQKLRGAYNAPQDSSDRDKLELFRTYPEQVPSLPGFSGKSAEEIAKTAEILLAISTLSEEQWRESQLIREHLGHELHFVFNFSRLIKCLKEAADADLDGLTDYDVLLQQRQLEAETYSTRPIKE